MIQELSDFSHAKKVRDGSYLSNFSVNRITWCNFEKEKKITEYERVVKCQDNGQWSKKQWGQIQGAALVLERFLKVGVAWSRVGPCPQSFVYVAGTVHSTSAEGTSAMNCMHECLWKTLSQDCPQCNGEVAFSSSMCIYNVNLKT